MREDISLSETIVLVGERLGEDDYLREKIRDVSPLLNDEGLKNYVRLIGMFVSFDHSVSLRLLKTGRGLFSAIDDPDTCTEVLNEVIRMGRAKWSVAAEALKTLPLVAHMPSGFLADWLSLGNRIGEIDQDVAIQYIAVSPPVYEILGTARFVHWASWGRKITEMAWKAGREYFKASPDVLKRVDPCEIERWASLGMHLIEKSPRVKTGYGAHSLFAQGTGAGKPRVIDLAAQYFRSSPQILGRLSMNDLEQWVVKGLEAVDSGRDKGTAFFSLETGSSRETVENLVKGTELRDIYSVLNRSAAFLVDRRIRIRSSSLFYKNLPGLGRFFSVTDGTRIFLPSRISVFEDEEMNFKTYKCTLAHEIAHILFGTFDIGPDRVNRLSDSDRHVHAFRIFEFLEDERVDYLMGREYPGLEKDRRMIMDNYLSRIPHGDNGGRSVFASLGFQLPDTFDKSGTKKSELRSVLEGALKEVRDPAQTVQGVLELTMKICSCPGNERPLEFSESRQAYERLFYRGIIDYRLVESARAGMSHLLSEMMERFNEGGREVDSEVIEEAVLRIEECEGPESELLLWQTGDNRELDELYERVELIVTDIEEESRYRRSVYYDEWDLELNDYRKDWCRVREIEMPPTTLSFYNDTISVNYGLVSLLRRHFGLLRPDRIKRYFREERGDDFDLDALIESIVDRRAGVTPSDRVYIRRDKKLRDVSVAFLVDMSYSTGEELPSGKRIIDIEKEGLVLMAEALESIGDRWAVYGFSTNYRDRVDFYIVRDFNEPFNDEVKMRFESIQPMAQTRLGSAVRHANKLLEKQDSLIRLLILLSDGRPYDIDYGELDYAVEDTRMALWEGRSRGISSFCITVDKRSREYLSHMYGESNYTIIDNIESLPTSLPLIYKRLTT